MTESLQPRPVSASRISLAQMSQPENANALGNVHGGWIMKLADEAGALVCMRHAHRPVVTVAVDSMVFHNPIRIGDLVLITAQVTYAGRTSLEAEVYVETENPITGERTETNTAYLVYVALGNDGRPVAVPPLLAETEEEKRKLEEGRQRQARRLESRK